MRRAPIALLSCVALSVSALAACGSDSLENTSSGGSGDSPSSEVSITKDDKLAAMVPPEIAQKGTLQIGTDASYAPAEFLDADGKTVKGYDVDLMDAVATKLGLKTDWKPSKFDSIITGVLGKKYDAGVSSFTINAKRMEQVNMVSYFNAGTLWATAPDNPKNVDPTKPCGLTIAVQKGTVQEEEDMPAKVKECKDSGKPVDLLIYEGQDQATAAVASGKADAMLADSPVVAYAVKQSGGKIESLGEIYDSAPYGFVVPKEQTELADALVETLKSMKEDGSYEQILKNWGVEGGAIDNFEVNPKTS